MEVSAVYSFSWRVSAQGGCTGNAWDPNVGAGPVIGCGRLFSDGISAVGPGVVTDVTYSESVQACLPNENRTDLASCAAPLVSSGDGSSLYTVTAGEIRFRCILPPNSGTQPFGSVLWPSLFSYCPQLTGSIVYDVSLSILCGDSLSALSTCYGPNVEGELFVAADCSDGAICAVPNLAACTAPTLSRIIEQNQPIPGQCMTTVASSGSTPPPTPLRTADPAPTGNPGDTSSNTSKGFSLRPSPLKMLAFAAIMTAGISL